MPAELPPSAVAGGRSPSPQAPAAQPPSVNVDDVVSVSDAADDAADGHMDADDNKKQPDAAISDERREIVDQSSADDTA